MAATVQPEEASWKDLTLAEANSACLALASSPDKKNAIRRLTIIGPILGLNGAQPSQEQQEEIGSILETIASLPNLAELTLQDDPYSWIPQDWLGSKLEKLVVHDSDESLDAFLMSQPSIRHLELWSLQNPREWSKHAPPNVLPALEHVAGYPAVIQHYVPGHPVHTIRVPMITNAVPVNEILEAAKASTMEVTTLDVAVREEERYTAVTEIAAALGDSLKSLTVQYHRGKKIDSREAISVLLDDWVTGVSKAKALRSFSPMIWFSNYPEGDGNFIAEQLGEACASLCTVQFRGATWVLEGQEWVERT